ncbi:hypothetical protein D1B33_07150 [Lysinibacillus yapensis]|uniref:Uncharacterized protein n=1 Tax=Ureibacillus yapensis TaxID=2304605 RepID=A0A396SIT8_9BACL|nr:hypothetical protein [Lysinibacillus yapensis]RHW38645.1 hypothetical protein D1B33_07150 [Lysinibacillus yapensis]
MSTKIPTEKSLNLLQLKEQMDEIVFNYIDTSSKWEIAYSKINELLQIAVHHFERYVEVNGELPKENTYWVLFLNLGYKLIYFHTISDYQLKEQPSEADKKRAVELLTLSAKCIPNVQSENHAEFLEEIIKSLVHIQEEQGKQNELKKVILDLNNRPCDCLQSFLEASKYYSN